MKSYELVPERLVQAFALAFLVAEALAGVLLAPTATRGIGIVLAMLVILAATTAVVVNLGRGRRVLDCGCGGISGRQPISWWLVARNAMLIVVLLAAPALVSMALDVVSLSFGAVAFVLIYAGADQLLANSLRQATLRRPA